MNHGYLVLNRIVGLFTDDVQVLFAVIAMIGILLYYSAIIYERKNTNMFLTIFLFSTILYFYFIGIVRLFIASAIIAYALRYVFKKRTKTYIFFVILATMFHYSAIFMIFLVYFSTEKEDKPRSIRNIILLVTIIMPIAILIVSQVIFPNMGERYENKTVLTGFQLSLGQFDKLPLIIFAMILQKDLMKISKNIRVYTIIYAMTTVIAIYSSMLPIGRIQWYTNFSMCILLPYIVRYFIKNKKYQSFNIILVPVILALGTYYAYRIIYVEKANTGLREYSNVLFEGD